MKTVNVSLQVLPGVPECEIYDVVDKAIEYIQSTGVKHIVGPMETTMEGEYDQLMDIVKRCQEIVFENGAERVVSVIKIDAKKDGVTMDEKIYKYR
ncbi:MTH1187 family thiamine-binding protein [Alkalibacter saccharofermentans]|jgi:uncharacterized protein (TIGR00106 family)|uniref:Uncharacterized protein, MTH1187 family n=1 Tax=Alkalibacter saccharofermentans DSM 14828 TaxID=1120975 RepID=A0A1M4SIR7_9FIRM|nr:MTH1187 family thiamine-binding protein [Alkalibacter saccharofermentans]SHE32105.1 uncharacterized protein, MTH1187 family [Alkalibacter saccharofermentans DSM 14828]